MAYASYRLHRIGWVAWRWVAEYRDEHRRRGVALTEGAARAAARAWLQAMADADGGAELQTPPAQQPRIEAPQAAPADAAPPRPSRRVAAAPPRASRGPAPQGPAPGHFGRRAAAPALSRSPQV